MVPDFMEQGMCDVEQEDPVLYLWMGALAVP
jgi:hypothetical protein